MRSNFPSFDEHLEIYENIGSENRYKIISSIFQEILNPILAGKYYLLYVRKIYTPMFWSFRKRVVNIAISELRPMSNGRSGNFTFSYF